MKPHLTFSLVGELLKSTDTDRIKLADLNFGIGADKDFLFETAVAAGTPVTVTMGNVTEAEFLLVQVTGGDCTVTLKVGSNTLDVPVNVGLVLTGTSIKVMTVASTAGCRVLIYGASQ